MFSHISLTHLMRHTALNIFPFSHTPVTKSLCLFFPPPPTHYSLPPPTPLTKSLLPFTPLTKSLLSSPSSPLCPHQIYSLLSPFFPSLPSPNSLPPHTPHHIPPHSLQTFQEEMANHQPDMDALSKAEKAHKGKGGKHSGHELDKKIRSLHKRWQKLWMRMAERHRLLLEGKTRTQDVAMAKSFDFESWRHRFNLYVDRNKLRLKELFRNVDTNHDGNLTSDELMKALRASGEEWVGMLRNKIFTYVHTLMDVRTYVCHCIVV